MTSAKGRANDDPTLPPLVSDNMVLQRGMKVALWGQCPPGRTVSISLGGVPKGRAKADRKRHWKATLGPLDAGGPYDMTIGVEGSSSPPRVIKNVCVGEVWVASGQSNMEMPVGANMWSTGVTNCAAEVAAANFPMIREFAVPHLVASQPQDETPGAWRVCSPATVAAFSAAGYFFARDLYRNLNVPIGIIHSSWGGMPAEAFTSLPALRALKVCAPILKRYQVAAAAFGPQLRRFEKNFAAWKKAAANAERKGDVVPSPPPFPGDPRSAPNRPAGLFNSMIAPLARCAIRGAIWYQGESNADRSYQYRDLFAGMIKDWRRAWRQGDFPFLFVQLANFGSWWVAPEGDTWPELREAQLRTLDLPQTGMAVAIDIGDAVNIHPLNKQDVGRRLALAARAVAYGQNIVYSGPIYDSMSIEGDKTRLRFRHTGGGLAAKDAKGRLGADAPLQTFVLAGPDRKFVPAQARIEGDTVLVWADAVTRPAAVRYAWLNNPQGCNLYNQEGLPASPFRTDGWPGVTDEKR